MKDKPIIVWWHDLQTGVPTAHKAAYVRGPYVRYVDGSYSVNWHYTTRKAAERAGRGAILARLREDRAYAARMLRTAGLRLEAAR
jgi:hypothetical protein